MKDYTLNTEVRYGKPHVRYLLKEKGGVLVAGYVTVHGARALLKGHEPRATQEFAGYGLTGDGVYFFDGSVADDSRAASGKVELGADGLPIPAVGTRKKGAAKK